MQIPEDTTDLDGRRSVNDPCVGSGRVLLAAAEIPELPLRWSRRRSKMHADDACIPCHGPRQARLVSEEAKEAPSLRRNNDCNDLARQASRSGGRNRGHQVFGDIGRIDVGQFRREMNTHTSAGSSAVYSLHLTRGVAWGHHGGRNRPRKRGYTVMVNGTDDDDVIELRTNGKSADGFDIYGNGDLFTTRLRSQTSRRHAHHSDRSRLGHCRFESPAMIGPLLSTCGENDSV